MIVTDPALPTDCDDLRPRHPVQLGTRLPNSEAIAELPSLLQHLPAEHCQDIINHVEQNKCVLSDVPSTTTVIQHDIELTDPRPIKKHPYRANQFKRELMKGEVQYLHKNGFAEPSSSPWSLPCLAETKPDGSPRFMVMVIFVR